jgi:DNA-binding MarR family transcriptional regulator
MSRKDLELAAEIRTVTTRLIKKLRKESIIWQHLSLTERSTLSSLLNNGPMLPSELAASEKITNQSMSQILNHLLELGLIGRTASETDKRKVIITINDAGKEMIAQARSEKEQWLAEAIRETCSAEEQEVIHQALELLGRIVDFK